MLFKFLHSDDTKLIIKDELLSSGFESDQAMNNMLKKSERTAVSMVKNKISGRIDIATAMPVILEWDSGKSYLEGQSTYRYGKFYVATADNSNSDPAEGNNWNQEDTRDPILVLHTAAITVYLAIQQSSGMKMPKGVRAMYDEAMSWLNDIKDWIQDTELPESDQDDDEIVYSLGVDVQDNFY